MIKRVIFVLLTLVIFSSKAFPDATFVSSRYMENAEQFDESEGVRTRKESPDSLKGDSRAPDPAGVEVDPGNKQPKKTPKKTFGPSFSDMASNVQQPSKPSGGFGGFNDLAKAARGGKEKQQTATAPTQNRNAIDRLFSPGKTSQPKPKAQPAKRQYEWGDEP